MTHLLCGETMACCHHYQHWLKWPLPWCVGPLCAGSSSENPGCLALQSGSDVEGLWVPPNTQIDNPQRGCHLVLPQREPVPKSQGIPQPSALHPKPKKRSMWWWGCYWFTVKIKNKNNCLRVHTKIVFNGVCILLNFQQTIYLDFLQT